jgi:hypothetical protein
MVVMETTFWRGQTFVRRDDPGGIKPMKAYYICGTHWDREWYEPFQEYRLWLVQNLDDIMDRRGAGCSTSTDRPSRWRTTSKSGPNGGNSLYASSRQAASSPAPGT